jgi:hypothetical protein
LPGRKHHDLEPFGEQLLDDRPVATLDRDPPDRQPAQRHRQRL